MNPTIGCPIPGASQPKEPVRLIDANGILRSIDVNGSAYDGSEYQAYKAGVEYVRSLIEDAPAINPEFMRPEEEWISVKDRLPEKDEYVLCFCNIGDGFQAIFNFTKERKFNGTAVTHWMPLPKPPEVNTDV